MNILFVCSILFCVISPNFAIKWEKFIPTHGLPPINDPNAKITNDFVKTGLLEIPLDHYNKNDNRTWIMKYYSNNQFYQKNGPVFIMLGGEWTITTDWVQYGQMFDIAQQTGAQMFYTQHRLYGDPLFAKNGLNLDVDHLKYLVTDQALADFAYFVKTIKQEFTNSKVVVFGGSYAGTLSLLMRKRYPEIIHGAVASSPPFKAVLYPPRFQESVFGALGKKCTNTIQNAVIQIVNQLGTPQGAEKFQRDYNMCKPVDITNPLDISYIFMTIVTHFENVVQYANCGSIESTCSKLMEPEHLDDYIKLALYLNETFRPDCLPNYQELKEHLTDLTPSGRNTRQWYYQQCKEFGYFRTYDYIDSLYLISVDMYHIWCAEFFDASFNKEVSRNGVEKTNVFFAGILNNTRIISVHGTADPWHLIGNVADGTPNVIFVEGTSHCQDLYPISGCDSPQLIETKLTVQKYVKQWLNED